MGAPWSRAATVLALRVAPPLEHAAGFLFLALTNWLTVEIPVRIGAAIDSLTETRHT